MDRDTQPSISTYINNGVFYYLVILYCTVLYCGSSVQQHSVLWLFFVAGCNLYVRAAVSCDYEYDYDHDYDHVPAVYFPLTHIQLKLLIGNLF